MGCSQTPHSLDHFDQHRLGVAVNHVAVFRVKKFVDNTRVAFAFATLDDVHFFRLVGIENGHSKNRGTFVSAGRGIHDVVGSNNESDIGGFATG